MSSSAAGGPTVSIVVPVYRSEGTLRPLFERLSTAMEGTPGGWEVVFVDDASPDGSWHILEELQGSNRERVVAVRLARNFGQHNALMCGFRDARGDVIVTMDDDLQNPPEEVPKLLSRPSGTQSSMSFTGDTGRRSIVPGGTAGPG
jgi:undecaprenyl-phosphate 4-deoxy-4-formamido-L-arabinose transferase